MKLTKVTLALALATGVLGWDDLILEPPSDKTGTPVAMLFGQGASIDTSQYEALGKAIQAAAPFPLWFGAPQNYFDTAAIPTTLTVGMSRIKSAMYEMGMPENITTFFGGHSLGGAMMPDYVENSEKDAAGMILMGSFLTRKHKTGATAEGRPQVEFPVPVLTVGAELDGLCRLTRIAEALYTQVTFAEDPAAAVRALPVTTIKGMSHMQFATGDPPSRVQKLDFVPEIETDAAQAAVAYDTAAFMAAVLGEADWDPLETRAALSAESVQPIVDSLLMEAYTHFLPPCYCESKDEYGYLQYGTCLDYANCSGGVPWTHEYSMQIMSNADELGVTINNDDSIHLVTEEFPSCHLPHIHGNETNNANPGSPEEGTPPLCDAPTADCHLQITSVTQPLYKNDGTWDYQDTGTDPIAATELRTKLKSRQSVYHAVGVENVSFAETDMVVSDGGSGDRCAEINQASIDWAFASLPQDVADRYTKYGQKLQVGADKTTCAAGPCWINSALKVTKDDDANTATVVSTMMATENYNKYPCGEDKLLPCATGFHYCKILSPAMAVEWMYVDGLRNLMSLSS